MEQGPLLANEQMAGMLSGNRTSSLLFYQQTSQCGDYAALTMDDPGLVVFEVRG